VTCLEGTYRLFTFIILRWSPFFNLSYARESNEIPIDTPSISSTKSFTSSPWQLQNEYFGTGASFVWKMRHKPGDPSSSFYEEKGCDNKLHAFPLSTEGTPVQLCRYDIMGVGVGDIHSHNENSDQFVGKDADDLGFAIVLDRNLLRGKTSPSNAFCSPRLTNEGDGTFEVRNLEIWTFTPCSNVENAKQLELSTFLNQNPKQSPEITVTGAITHTTNPLKPKKSQCDKSGVSREFSECPFDEEKKCNTIIEEIGSISEELIEAQSENDDIEICSDRGLALIQNSMDCNHLSGVRKVGYDDNGIMPSYPRELNPLELEINSGRYVTISEHEENESKEQDANNDNSADTICCCLDSSVDDMIDENITKSQRSIEKQWNSNKLEFGDLTNLTEECTSYDAGQSSVELIYAESQILENKIKTLKFCIEKEQNAIQDLSSERDSLGSSLEQLQEKEEQMHSEIASSKCEIDKLQEANNELQNLSTDQQEKLSRAETSYGELQKEKAEAIERLRVEIDGMQNSIDIFLIERNEALPMMKLLEKDLAAKDSKLLFLSNANNDLLEENSESDRKLKEVEHSFLSSVKGKEDAIDRLREEMVQKQNAIKDLWNTRDQLAAQMENLIESEFHRETFIATCKIELDKERDLNTELFQQNTDLELKLKDDEHKFTKSSSEKADVIDRLHLEVLEKQNAIESLSSEIKTWQGIGERKEIVINALKSQIQNLEKKLESVQREFVSSEEQSLNKIEDLRRQLDAEKLKEKKSDESKQKQIDNLNALHSQVLQEKVELIEALHKERKTKEDYIHTLVNDHRGVVEKKESLEMQICDITSQLEIVLEELVVSKKKAVHEREALCTDLKSGQNAIEVLNESVSEKEHCIKELQKIIEEKQNSIDSLDSDRLCATVRMEKMEADRCKIQNQLKCLQQELLDAKKEIEIQRKDMCEKRSETDVHLEKINLAHASELEGKDLIISDLKEEVEVLESVKCMIVEKERIATAALIEHLQDENTLASKSDDGLKRTLQDIRVRISKHLEEEVSATFLTEKELNDEVEMSFIASLAERDKLIKHLQEVISEKHTLFESLTQEHKEAIEKEYLLSKDLIDAKDCLDAASVDAKEASEKLNNESNKLAAANDTIASCKASIHSKEIEIDSLSEEIKILLNKVELAEEEQRRLKDEHERCTEAIQQESRRAASDHTAEMSELKTSRALEGDNFSLRSAEPIRTSRSQVVVLRDVEKKKTKSGIRKRFLFAFVPILIFLLMYTLLSIGSNDDIKVGSKDIVLSSDRQLVDSHAEGSKACGSLNNASNALAIMLLADYLRDVASTNTDLIDAFTETQEKLKAYHSKHIRVTELELKMQHLEIIRREEECFLQDKITGLESQLHGSQHAKNDLEKIDTTRRQQIVGLELQLNEEQTRKQHVKIELEKLDIARRREISELEMQLKEAKTRQDGQEKVIDSWKKVEQTKSVNGRSVNLVSAEQQTVYMVNPNETLPSNMVQVSTIKDQENAKSIGRIEQLSNLDPYRSSPLTPEILRQSQTMKTYLSPGYCLTEITQQRDSSKQRLSLINEIARGEMMLNRATL
jgi:chromosome segregation ATPase